MRFTRKILFIVICLFFIDSQLSHLRSYETRAKAALLVDHSTGQTLYGKNEDLRIYPASMSKLMTLYVLFETLDEGIIGLDEKFIVSMNAYQREGSTIYAELSTMISVEDLIKGIIVSSGNDACVVVAEALAGSEENFAMQMNLIAKDMGLLNTSFTNSTGLHNENHFSSPTDLVLLATRLLDDFPQFYKYFSETSFTWNNIIQYNRNNLLRMDLGVDGLKTGHTRQSGYGIIVSSKRDNRRIIAFVSGLNSNDERTSEILKLLNYSYRGFKSYQILKKDQVIEKVKVWKGKKETVSLIVDEDINLLLDIPARRGIRLEYLYKEPIIAPINKGDKLGEVHIIYPNSETIEVPLVAGEEVKKKNAFINVIDAIRHFIFRDG
ncbi:MAG: D-alanyl-D-alanine carboxypeptidase family protein [Pseudomonadota bacterium]|nr:D-alanyl-D-alanine carboxypeptidase family protein [Pseudomonadota bacterium]